MTSLACVRDENSMDRQISAFLNGDNNGEALLHQLYDHVLDEPLPEQMRKLLPH